MIPKLIPQPKWFAQSPEIKVSDIVYFQKTEADLDSVWTVGQIDSVVKGRDGNVRRVKIRYHNGNERDCPPRFTDRAARSIVRLFNIEDNYFIDDMKEVELMIENLNKKAVENGRVEPIKLVKGADGNYSLVEANVSQISACGECCCEGHCHGHANKVTMVTLSDIIKVSEADDTFIDPDDTVTDQHDVHVCDSTPGVNDEFEKLLYALETQFDPEAIEECDYLDPPPHCSHLPDDLP